LPRYDDDDDDDNDDNNVDAQWTIDGIPNFREQFPLIIVVVKHWITENEMDDIALRGSP
jgi:hypothetical protein